MVGCKQGREHHTYTHTVPTPSQTLTHKKKNKKKKHPPKIKKIAEEEEGDEERRKERIYLAMKN